MVHASYTIVCKPQPLRHDISRRGSQINLPFFHLVHFFQLYNILKNQNRAFFTPRPPPLALTSNYTPQPPPTPLNPKLHPLNLHLRPSTSTPTHLPQTTPLYFKLHPSTSTSTSYLKQHPFNLHLHPFKRKLNPSTSTSTLYLKLHLLTSTPLPQTSPLNLHPFSLKLHPSTSTPLTSNYTPSTSTCAL